MEQSRPTRLICNSASRNDQFFFQDHLRCRWTSKLQVPLAKRVICWYRRICINSTVAMEMFIALHRWWSTQNLHNELQVGNFPSRLNGTLEWEVMGQKPGNQPQKDSHLYLHYFQSLMFADVHNYFLNQSGRPENDTCLQNEKHLDCKTDVFVLSFLAR